MKSSRGNATARSVAVPEVDLESNIRYLDGLAKFLSLRGNTLLIKGYAGAGKTTLSLQLLQQLAKDGCGIYVSSRVSQDKVGRHLPWVKNGKISGQKYKFLDIRLGTASSVLEELTRAINVRGRGKKPSDGSVRLGAFRGELPHPQADEDSLRIYE